MAGFNEAKARALDATKHPPAARKLALIDCLRHYKLPAIWRSHYSATI
jgi:hypothetical protein